MATAPDGSPVELYALLPDRGEAELVARAVAPPARILELGCGTGRMTRQLVEAGFEVVAVDESAAMLEHVRGAETVCAPIEELELGRRFDLVLLASNLLTVEPRRRRRFLEACGRHAELVAVEMLPLAWRPEEGETQLGAVTARLVVDRVRDGVVHGTMEYAAGSREWRHPFAMRVFESEDELEAALRYGGFRFDRWLDRERGWFLARAARAPS